MKNYFKILFITMMIQLAGFGILFIFNNMMSAGNLLGDVGFWIFLASFPIAIIVDIVLAIRWGENLKHKLVCIFLMPTNYVGPILFVGFYLYIGWALKQVFGM